jgi:FAD/FMN-containing dehydrogenase/Fe-S oxidoreductase
MTNRHSFTGFIKDLKSKLKGDVLSDDFSLGMYATDASVYQIKPIAVALPKDENDVLVALRLAAGYRVPVLPRGGGTSLSGQTVGEALVLDFTKYMHNVLEVNVEERWARVQPGVIRDELNARLKPHRLHYAPDPATTSRAVIGGMIANNSSGTRSIVYGKAVDHVLELKIALHDGTVLILGELTPEQWDEKTRRKDREGEIYHRFREIVFRNTEEIIARYPKTMRRVQGYNLDEFTGTPNWNLAKIISGSEGTLATILEAKINLEPLPKHRCLVVAHFTGFLESIRATEPMLEFQPCAVELVDRSVLDMSRQNLSTAPLCWFLDGDPEAILSIEFQGDTLEECLDRAQRMVAKMKALGYGYAFPVLTKENEMNDVLTVRQKGLGLVLGKKSDKRALSFIEDAAIPVPQLAGYIEQVLKICEKYGVEVSAYAHASVGVLHVKPFLDLRTAEDIEKYKAISEEAFQLVKQYGGSWSSEHGDGLVRSAYLERFFGPQIYKALKEVKSLFDPYNRMNPGKIIDAEPIDTHLRYGTAYRDEPVSTIYQYRSERWKTGMTAGEGFAEAVHLCTGVGECRKVRGGTMCPSYRATLDEEHSTRGRANALRLAMSGQLSPADGLTAPRLREVLDLCLSCKACKSECPSNVDMAKLKGELLQKMYDRHGIPLRDRFVRDSVAWAKRLSGSLAPVVNAVQHTGAFKWLLEKTAGISAARTLPDYTGETFVKWFEKQSFTTKNDPVGKVALFADSYLNYYEPQVGKSALLLLTALGYEVHVEETGCCQRPKISHGFLRDAKKEGTRTARRLDELFRQGYEVVVCEPSCATALTDDLPDLLDDEALGQRLQRHVFPIEIFLQKEMQAGRAVPALNGGTGSVLVHGHCHQKALYGTAAMKEILSRIAGLQVEEVDSGCCGMAGSFGYEKEHVALSEKIGELSLFPKLRTLPKETEVIACGFSCRHQIGNFTGRKAKHWVEVFAQFSGNF